MIPFRPDEGVSPGQKAGTRRVHQKIETQLVIPDPLHILGEKAWLSHRGRVIFAVTPSSSRTSRTTAYSAVSPIWTRPPGR